MQLIADLVVADPDHELSLGGIILFLFVSYDSLAVINVFEQFLVLVVLLGIVW